MQSAPSYLICACCESDACSLHLPTLFVPVVSQMHAEGTFLPYFFQDPFLHFLIHAYVYLQLSPPNPSMDFSSSLHITSPTITS